MAVNVRRMTRLSLLVAAGLMLNLIERQLPPPAPVPGVRLGLANVATLVALALDGPGGAFLVWAVRFLLASLLGGGLFGPAFLVGGAGGLAAWAAMAAVARFRVFGAAGISAAGAIAHHIGQIAAAAVVTATPAVVFLLPILLALGVPVGFVTGLAVALVLRRLSWAGMALEWPGGPPGGIGAPMPMAGAAGRVGTAGRRGLIRRSDLALAVVACLAALALAAGRPLWQRAVQSGPPAAEVTVAGKAVLNLDLQQDGLYPLEAGGGHLVIEVLDGAVRVRESDCPDQICVLTGWVRRPGEVVVCAPYRVAVRVTGRATEGPDAILR